MPIQTPTVGRRCWFWPEDHMRAIDANQPFDAGVLFVHPDGTVNLAVADHVGYQQIHYKVQLLNERKAGCAQWMPYQQAKHAEETKAAEPIAPFPELIPLPVIDPPERPAVTAGPTVSLRQINDEILQENYFLASHGAEVAPYDASYWSDEDERTKVKHRELHESMSLLTLCVLVMRNGFTVVGKSAVASPDNFNAAKGREIARADAVRQVWPLLGFQLRTALAQS